MPLRAVANGGQIPIARGLLAGRVQCFPHLGSDPYWRVGAIGDPRPGGAPGGAVTFLLRKRKVTKRKAPQLSAPSASATGTCGARFGRGLAKLACGSNNASPFPSKPVLLGAHRWGPRGSGSVALGATSCLGHEANGGRIPIARCLLAGRVLCFPHLGSDPYWRFGVNVSQSNLNRSHLSC